MNWLDNYYAFRGNLAHYGVKGMKWGVRNGPPYPLHHENLKEASDVTIKKKNKVISGHSPSPKKSTPNSITDHVDEDGKVDTRTIYDNNGDKKTDISTSDHGNPKQHPYGKNGEHAHDYEWNSDGSLKNRTTREITDEERKENDDIL